MKAKNRNLFVAGVALAGLVLSTLVLVTCDSTNFLAAITTEVKKATGKLLIVSVMDPANAASNVNPGMRMSVTFDRSIDLATVDATTVTISPAPDFHLDFDYNDATKTLYIDSDPWLGDATDYTLTISKSVKGADGSELEYDHSWSFRTGIYPKGNVRIEADKPFTNKAFPSRVSLTVTCNALGYGYRLGSTEAECLANTTWYTATATNFTDTTNYSFPNGAADGQQTIFIQFQKISDGTLSSIRNDTITLDTVKPVISIGTPTLYHGPAGAPTASVTASDDRSGVDTTSYVWANDANTTVTPPNSPTPTISVSGADSTRPVAVTVKDIAGNTSVAGTVTVIKDMTAPNLPPEFAYSPVSPAFAAIPEPRWDWKSISTGGGETTPIFKYELRDSANTLYYQKASTTVTRLQMKPVDWPDYSRRLQPGTYTLKVWERDIAGNYSAPVTSAPFVVTSILPEHGSEGLTIPVTLKWWTIANPADPAENPYPREGYVLHWGQLDVDGNLTHEERPREVLQIEGADPYDQLTGLDLKDGTSYGWYVVIPEWKDLRVPSLESRDPFWTFTTAAR